MDYYVGILAKENQDLNEDLVNSIVDSTGQELVEDENNYEIFETDEGLALIVELSRHLEKHESDEFAKNLSEKLFDLGYNNFDIEVSIDENSEI